MQTETKTEFDLHVLVEPETKEMMALYTLSVGRRAVAFESTLDVAVSAFRELLEEEAE